MKKMIMTIAAAIGLAAFGYEYIGVGTKPAPASGKLVAVDVASTNQADSVTFKSIRHISQYTNGVSISTTTWTNSVSVFDYSNRVWTVTNIVYTAAQTNAVKLLAFDKWTTNSIITAVCDNNFATSNITDGVWLFDGDFIFADGLDAGGKAKLVIEK